jgi:hypothetical protein
MNELFDKLILRVIFTLFICLTLYLYKYIHALLYPSTQSQLLKNVNPNKNSADSLFFFGRLIGLGILFSEFHFTLDNGILIALTDFLIKASVGFVIYLGSIYVVESIVLYSFEYHDEIIKRKSMPYALIGVGHSIGNAFILKIVLNIANNSLVMLVFLWLFSLVLVGFATKTYNMMSRLSFNALLIQKNMAVAISYFFFYLGWSMVIASALNNPLLQLKEYSIQVILKILLSIIILPIFIYGIKFIFNLHEGHYKDKGSDTIKEVSAVDIGHGIYEGSIFFTACFLTSVITGRIYFSTFYPNF